MGPRYILVAVDQFSKLTYLESIARLTGEVVAAAFERIVSRMGYNVQKVISDAGPEFVSAPFQKLLQRHSAKHVIAGPTFPNKAFLAENRNLLIRRLLARGKEGKVGLHMATLLPKIEEWINTTPNSRTGLSPKATTDDMAPLVLTSLRRHRLALTKALKVKEPLFSSGDLVRVRQSQQRAGGQFAKASTPTYSRQVYRVMSVKRTSPWPSYKLAIKGADTLSGTYSERDLIKANNGEDTGAALGGGDED